MEIKNLDELKELLSIGAQVREEERNNQLNLMWFYIGADRKIQAIKAYRSASNTSLHDAKDHVEWLMNHVAPDIERPL